MGGFFINQFNLYGRVWQVNVQADAKDRSRFDDIYRASMSRESQGRDVIRCAR